MFRFILKTVGAIAGVIVILIMILSLKEIQPNNYLQAYKLKCELLENTPGPRLIFVGGSNLAFGINSKRIADSLGINVINTGLHAGVGIKFMLDDVSQYVRVGDILIIAPEYNHFYRSIDAPTFAFVHAIAGWKKLHLLDWLQFKELLRGLPSVVYHRPDKTEVYEYYQASNFNEVGDMAGHWSDSTGLSSIPVTSQISAPFDEKTAAYFVMKVCELKKRVEVYVIPPVCRASAFKAMGNVPVEVANYLKDKGILFIVDPETHVKSDEYALDTDFHMNGKGVQVFTEQLIQELRPYMGGYNND